MEFNATFIVSAISFVFFVLIMNAIFYKPLQKIVEERQKFVDDTYKEAKVHREKSEVILKDRDEKLAETKHNAKKIISDKSEQVKAQKIQLASEAQQKAASHIENSKNELQKSSQDAQISLEKEAENIAQKIMTKILGKV